MVNRSSRPFHRQVTGLFVWAFLTFFIVLSALGAVFHLQYQQTNFIQNQQLPQLAQSQALRQVLRDATKQIEVIFAQQSAANFPEQHKVLDQYFRQLRYSPYKSVVLPRESFYRAASLELNLTRLSKNSAINSPLKQQVHDKFQQAITRFRTEFIDKEVKQQQLYNQIANDRANDRITANRARAYALITKELTNFHQLNDLLIAINNELAVLSIQTPLDRFEFLSEQILTAFERYQQLSEAGLITNEQLKSQFEQLDQLLLSEQYMLSKWRGYLRIAEPYLAALSLQKTQLLSALAQPINNNDLLLIEVDSPIQAALAKVNLNISHQHLVWSITLVAIVFAAVLILLLLRLRRKIKVHGQDSILLCQQLQDNPELAVENFLSFEHRQIAKLLNCVNKPLHSEKDYQQLIAQHQLEGDWLLKQGNIAVWSNLQDQVQRKKLVNFLFSQTEQKNLAISHRWKSWFNQDNYKLLLAGASEAKKSAELQRLHVKTRSEQTLVITISYQNNVYSGTLQNVNQLHALMQQLQHAEQNHALFEQAFNQQRYQQAQQQVKATITAALQNQSVLLDAGIPSLKLHRRLMKTLATSQQSLRLTRLQMADHALELSDFNFRDKLYVAAFNAIQTAHNQKNKISVHCQPEITQYARLDVELFVELITALTQSLLTERFNANLTLTCQLADKNPGQQIITLLAKVDSEKAIKALPEVLSTFNHQNALISSDTLFGFQAYIQTLFSALHIKNVQTDFAQHSYQLSIDLPIATVDCLPNTPLNKGTKQDTVDFKKANVLLLGTKSALLTSFSEALIKSHATVSIVDNMNGVSQALSPDSEEKNFDTVAVLPDFYLSDFANINEHVKALKAHCQPKLMVVQPLFYAPFSRHGLYSQANMPLSEDGLVDELYQLLESDKNTNCLMESTNFEQHRPSVSACEVLLAVSCPAKQQILTRLLQWLGLQITLVNDEASANKKWKSGQFLMLITEFNQSPFIHLATGQSIKRGVFYFSEQQFSLLTTEEAAIADNWLVEALPSVDKISEIINLFKPWLTFDKQVAKTVQHETSPPPTLQVAESSSDRAQEESDDETSLIEDFFTEYNLDDFESLDVNAAFDLELYALNQGSAELAALMLDTYVAELQQYNNEIKTAVQANETDNAAHALAELTVVAKVLAASEIIATCQQLAALLSESDDNDDMQKCFEQLAAQIKAVEEFADAI